jgi:hypothetical protein
MPVSRVVQGMSESASPIRVRRSAGMPERSQSIAAIAKAVTVSPITSKPTPLKVSEIAIARRPPKAA